MVQGQKKGSGLTRLARRIATSAEDYLNALERLSKHNEAEPEDVHAARVLGRRLVAGIALLGPVLPSRFKKASRQIRKTTRSLGQMRDSDIIAKRIADDGNKTASRIVRKLTRKRTSHQENAKIYAQTILLGKTGEIVTRLTEADWIDLRIARQGLLAHQFLRERMVPTVDQLTCRIAIVTKHPDNAMLHELRKTVKKVRYTLELALADGQATAAVLQSCKKLQDQLGELHDAWAALETVRAHIKTHKRLCSDDDLLFRLEDTLKSLRAGVLETWTPSRLTKFEQAVIKSADVVQLLQEERTAREVG